MASAWWACLSNVAATASRVHRVAGPSCSSVALLAMERTSHGCAGGKAPRSAGPRRVVEAGSALAERAAAPGRHRVAVAVALGGARAVGGVIQRGRAQDQPAANDQGVGRGPGVDQG